MATGEEALDLGEHHIRRKMAAVKTRQKEGSHRLDETIRSSRDLFLAGTPAATAMSTTSGGFFKKKAHGEGAFVGQHANEVLLMEPEHESTIPVEGTSALPDTQVVVDHSGIAATMEKQGWSRQFSLESGIQESAFVERIDSGELARQAKELTQNAKKKVVANPTSDDETPKSKRSLLVESVLGGQAKKENHKSHKKGAFAGVFVPTCENMWGVLIFLRFYFVVGQAGIMHALLCVLISFTAAFCTTSSMSAIVSSGGLVSKGGPCYMISRALGPSVGASVGIMYWLAITLLAVLETLGAVEALLMAAPSLNFPGCKQAFGSGFMIMLVLSVWGGTSFVTRLGIGFVLIVFYTMASYYAGIATAPLTEAAMANPWVTGISWETFKKNWGPHYDEHTNFGVVLSVFFPCFTGILSGANRADILKDPPRNIKDGTFGAIIFSFFMYSSFFLLWGCVADYRYLQGKEYHADGDDHHRRLAGGAGEHLVEEIVWNPFPNSAHIGIIISSLSQALQCLIVAPRLLQNIARLSKFMNAESLTRQKEETNYAIPTLRQVIRVDDTIEMKQMVKSQLCALPTDPTLREKGPRRDPNAKLRHMTSYRPL